MSEPIELTRAREAAKRAQEAAIEAYERVCEAPTWEGRNLVACARREAEEAEDEYWSVAEEYFGHLPLTEWPPLFDCE